MSKLVYVLYGTNHLESRTTIKGIYKTRDKAVLQALNTREMEEITTDVQGIDNNSDKLALYMNRLLREYQMGNIPNKEQSRFDLFKKLCKLQTSSYLNIEVFPIQ